MGYEQREFILFDLSVQYEMVGTPENYKCTIIGVYYVSVS